MVCRIGADDRVGEGQGFAAVLAGEHALRQVFDVDLVDNAGSGRHDAQVAERLLRPVQKLVALAVALELDLAVAQHGAGDAGEIDLHRVVDHQVDRDERVDLLRVFAQAGQGGAHAGQVVEHRDAGEILQQHPPREEAHGGALGVLRLPASQAGHHQRLAGAQGVFEQDADGEGQAGKLRIAVLAELIQAVDGAAPAGGLQRLANVKRGFEHSVFL